MKRALAVGALMSLFVSVLAVAAPPTATGIWLAPSTNYAFVNCSAQGSSAQVIPNGKYLVRIMEADVNVLYDGVAFDGGALNNRPFPQGFGFLESFFADDGGTPISCQSADGGGDLYLTGTH